MSKSESSYSTIKAIHGVETKLEEIEINFQRMLNEIEKAEKITSEEQIVQKTIKEIGKNYTNVINMNSGVGKKIEEMKLCCKLISQTLENVGEEKRERRNELYAIKLKYCTRLYSKLNELLSLELQSLKRVYTSTQNQMHELVTSKDEIHQLEAKAKRYNNEILKLEKKHPWLKTREYTLPHILEEMQKMETAKQIHNDLMNEISAFETLKPDIDEAKRQLNNLANKYTQMIPNN